MEEEIGCKWRILSATFIQRAADVPPIEVPLRLFFCRSDRDRVL